MKPTHPHECKVCVLIGALSMPVLGDSIRTVTWDFYLCEMDDPPSRTLIARYGDHERDVIMSVAPIAGLAADTTKWPMNVAAQLVLAQKRVAMTRGVFDEVMPVLHRRARLRPGLTACGLWIDATVRIAGRDGRATGYEKPCASCAAAMGPPENDR